MITAVVITDSLAGIVMGVPKAMYWFWETLALTPIQRWEAMRWFNTNVITERWFIISGVVAVIILTALLFVVSLHRMSREQRVTNQLFV
ncbi:MAG: hypothetical protein ACYTBZ_30230, partial [Planctomycetota bacterium]